MNNILLKTISTGLCFLCIFFLGVWLSRSGKPYNALILAVHKLISLGVFVFFVITLYRVQQVSGLNVTELTAGLAASLLFITTIVSGGLLSANKELPAAVHTLHQITPFLTLFASIAAWYLLVNRQ